MASSLLFRIKSVFDSQGFNQAKGGFTSVLGTVGKLTAAVAVLVTNFGNLDGAMSVLTAKGTSFVGTAAKLVFSFRALGVAAAFFAFDIGKALVKTLVGSVPAAARAEIAFTRMRNQLELLGKGSQQNIKRIQEFSERVASSTQFSSGEAQEAVTTALRRTGNVEKAIKQVSVAQDIAAATGRDLISVTNLLNLAQAGNTRFLRQITNLRQADIEAATRQGRLLDLLSDKFGGSAARATSTLAAKTQILANVQEQIREEFGKVSLPIAKFGKDIEILVTRLALLGVKGAGSLKDLVTTGAGLTNFFRENTTFSDRFFANVANGVPALLALGQALKQSADDTKRFNDALSQDGGRQFDIARETEFQTLRLGKTIDERRTIAREFARADELIAVVQRNGADVLNKEQTEFLQRFQFGTKALSDAVRDRANKLEEEFKRTQERTQARRAEGNRRRGGALLDPQEVLAFAQNAQKAGASVKDIATGIKDLTGVSSISSTAIANSIIGIGAASDTVKSKIESLSTTLKSLTTPGALQTALSDVTQQVEKTIQARVQPKFNVNVDFQIPTEALQSAVLGAVNQVIPSIIARLTNAARNASREARANSSAT